MLKHGIEIQQRLAKGILGGPFRCDFSITLNSVLYEISIEQMVIRKTIISTNESVELDDLIAVFNKLDMLIMLGEGQFIPIKKAWIIKNGKSVESKELDSKIAMRLNLFNSCDFTIGNHSKFLSFDQYIDDNVFLKWIKMLEELDIVHPMVLYSMADTGMPIDCKTAFIIESFESLTDLIEKYNKSFIRPYVHKWESALKKYLCAIIELYGKDIFCKEDKANVERFAQILVNSRNRMAHIKSKQGRYYLNGSESILYAVKLSFLYRHILLTLLEVDYNFYKSQITKLVNDWDNWNGILEEFLKKF